MVFVVKDMVKRYRTAFYKEDNGKESDIQLYMINNKSAKPLASAANKAGMRKKPNETAANKAGMR